VLFVATLLGGAAVSAASTDSDVRAIQTLLDRSAAAWNRGDLATFMQSYDRAPDTVYISSHAVIRGYANIRAHYASAHPGAMGRLTLTDIAIRLLGTDYAVVVARWHLATADGKKPSGLFSLVLRRSSAGWRIITDHSP
jgi:uncharacterized protein (TIGR02246 family)